jgi:hypothetical protein
MDDRLMPPRTSKEGSTWTISGVLGNLKSMDEYGVNQDFRLDVTLTGVVSKLPAISQKR